MRRTRYEFILKDAGVVLEGEDEDDEAQYQDNEPQEKEAGLSDYTVGELQQMLDEKNSAFFQIASHWKKQKNKARSEEHKEKYDGRFVQELG